MNMQNICGRLIKCCTIRTFEAIKLFCTKKKYGAYYLFKCMDNVKSIKTVLLKDQQKDSSSVSDIDTQG